MSERSLRGTQLGSRSLESEVGVEPAPRQHIEYRCEDGHTFTVPFSMEADIPAQWDSGTHGIGVRVDGGDVEEAETKPVRTHWDMLLERRSFEELQVLLDERLAYRRGDLPASS